MISPMSIVAVRAGNEAVGFIIGNLEASDSQMNGIVRFFNGHDSQAVFRVVKVVVIILLGRGVEVSIDAYRIETCRFINLIQLRSWAMYAYLRTVTLIA